MLLLLLRMGLWRFKSRAKRSKKKCLPAMEERSAIGEEVSAGAVVDAVKEEVKPDPSAAGFYSARDVEHALDMAKVALEFTKKRAEDAEGQMDSLNARIAQTADSLTKVNACSTQSIPTQRHVLTQSFHFLTGERTVQRCA